MVGQWLEYVGMLKAAADTLAVIPNIFFISVEVHMAICWSFDLMSIPTKGGGGAVV